MSGRNEAEFTWNHVINFDSCSWLHETALRGRILNCHFFLIDTSKDVSTWPSEILRASLLTDTAGIRDRCFLPANLKSTSHLSIKQTTGLTTEELGSILQVERLRPSEHHHHPRVEERAETSPELLAPGLSYITPNSSSPWKLRPIPWKIVLFSPVFSRIQPA